MHTYQVARSSSVFKDSEHEMINQTERKGCSREFGKAQLRKNAFCPIEMQMLQNNPCKRPVLFVSGVSCYMLITVFFYDH